MARVSTYLNFPRSTEEAFLFYQSVFGTDFTTPIMRFGDIPAQPDQPTAPQQVGDTGQIAWRGGRQSVCADTGAGLW